MISDGRRLILILGGARSGKSSLAEALAERLAPAGDALYVATAEAGDEEMRARIAAHRGRRPAAWRTLEEPLRLGPAIAASASDARVVLVDCVTLWVTNLMLAAGGDAEETRLEVEGHVLDAVEALLAAHAAGSATYLLVSNEVGLGLVPPYPLGRAYRDLLGKVNQRLAAAADAVYFTVAGLPVELKALSRGLGVEGLTWPGDDS